MTISDVHRSLRRWAATLLGEPWTVRLEQRLSSPEDLSMDVAFVEIAVPMSSARARSGGVGALQGDAQRRATFSVTLLPVAQETPQESSLRASDLSETFFRAAEAGVINLSTGASFAPPMLIPLWSWAGVPVTGNPAARRGPQGAPLSYAEIEDLSSRPFPDPDDDRLYSVATTLRISWWVGGRGLPPGSIAAGGVAPYADPPLHI